MASELFEVAAHRAESRVEPPSHADELRSHQLELRRTAVERALRSPLFARKVQAAGVTPENAIDDAAWAAIEPITKDDLRTIPAEQLYREMVICQPAEIREYWRSGGVTGEPFYYPRTSEDLEAASIGFRRVFRAAGIGAGDSVHVSMPIGVHPAGQHMVRAAQAEGAAVVWAGAGSAMPSEAQVELIHKLGATAWSGLASYGLHLASIAAGLGKPFRQGKVRKLVSSAEPITPAKRSKIEQLWNAELFDGFGMSEVNMMSGECHRHTGLHLWTDLCYVEVLHPESHTPVPLGDEGLLCVTSLQTNHATPFIRWLSGDVIRMTEGCDCGTPFALFPLLHHAGRTMGFFKIRGVNVNHGDLEDMMLACPGVADYRLTLVNDGDREALRVEIECDEQPARGSVERAVAVLFEQQLGIAAAIEIVERGTLAGQFEGVVKPQRIVDGR
jgi:phenylacetate-CoA ligase